MLPRWLQPKDRNGLTRREREAALSHIEMRRQQMNEWFRTHHFCDGPGCKVCDESLQKEG